MQQEGGMKSKTELKDYQKNQLTYEPKEESYDPNLKS